MGTKDNFHWYRSHYVLIALGVTLTIGLIALLLSLRPDDGTTNPSAGSQVSSTSSAASVSAVVLPVASASVTARTALPPLPHSLQGTTVDGEIIIDENKQLVVTRGLRRLFDYFLSAQGEEPLETIHQRITDYIRGHTPEPAASQAIAIYQQYISYLKEVATIDHSLSNNQLETTRQGKLDLTLIADQQRRVKALQARIFDEKTRQAFFGSEQALNDYTYNVVSINQNTNLSESQKTQALAQAKSAYMSTFSPEMQAKLKNQENVEKLLAETERLKAQGASSETLNAMRRQYVSEEAVKRLNDLDQQEAAFAQRVANFEKQQAQIIAAQGNTPQAAQAIEALKQQQFSATEQLRLSAFAAMQQSSKTNKAQ